MCIYMNIVYYAFPPSTLRESWYALGVYINNMDRKKVFTQPSVFLCPFLFENSMKSFFLGKKYNTWAEVQHVTNTSFVCRLLHININLKILQPNGLLRGWHRMLEIFAGVELLHEVIRENEWCNLSACTWRQSVPVNTTVSFGSPACKP